MLSANEQSKRSFYDMNVSYENLIRGFGAYLALLGTTLLLALHPSNLYIPLLISSTLLLLVGLILYSFQWILYGYTLFQMVYLQISEWARTSYGIELRDWMVVSMVSGVTVWMILAGTNPQDVQNLIGNILPGLVTLMALTLTVITLGIQLASSRYSFRIDEVAASSDILIAYFWPHISAIVLGVYISLHSSSNQLHLLVGLFFMSIILSAFSIFSYVRWTLSILQPLNTVGRFRDQIDEGYIENVIKILEDKYEPMDEVSFIKRVAFMEVVSPDPLNIITDVALSQIRDGDTLAAQRVLDELTEVVEANLLPSDPVNRRSLLETKLLTWHFLGHYRRIFRQAENNGNEEVMLSIVDSVAAISRETIERDDAGTAFESLRLLRNLITDGQLDWSSEAVKNITDEVNSIGNRYTNQVRDEENVAGLALFLQIIRQVTFQSIQRGTHGRNLLSSITTLQTLSSEFIERGAFPKEVLITISIIGKEAARNKVVTHQMVLGADVGTSITDIAEWSIVSLVTIRDSLETTNPSGNQQATAEFIDRKIDSIEEELQKKDRYIVNHLNERLLVPETATKRVLSTLRRNRGGLPKEDLISIISEEMHDRTYVAERALKVLANLGVVSADENKVSSRLSSWRPAHEFSEIDPQLEEGEIMIAKVAGQ